MARRYSSIGNSLHVSAIIRCGNKLFFSHLKFINHILKSWLGKGDIGQITIVKKVIITKTMVFHVLFLSRCAKLVKLTIGNLQLM